VLGGAIVSKNVAEARQLGRKRDKRQVGCVSLEHVARPPDFKIVKELSDRHLIFLGTAQYPYTQK